MVQVTMLVFPYPGCQFLHQVGLIPKNDFHRNRAEIVQPSPAVSAKLCHDVFGDNRVDFPNHRRKHPLGIGVENDW